MSLSGMIVRAGVAAARGASPGLKSSSGGALAVSTRRSMTTFQEREKGEETVYMRREDKKLLQKILEKERAGAGKEAREELMKILGSNKLPSDVIDSLLAWKFS